MGNSLQVVEIFGPTLQGEGMLAGRPSHFVRLGGCDYRCLWCDSPFAVLPDKVRAEARKLTTAEVLTELVALKGNPDWVTISGGNPALQDCTSLVQALTDSAWKVAVETQGTVWRDWLNLTDVLTVSPKPPSSNMVKPGQQDSLKAFLGMVDWNNGPQAILKVPVFDEADYQWAIALHETFPKVPFYFSLVTRMGGLYGDFDGGTVDTPNDILHRYKWLAERVAADAQARDVAVLPQLHVLLWGHARGR